ncbi:hypothetical protein VA249_46130 (plasmid) [Vibrio alfacsensis]|uniref:hypothetical protein n=1 Tax=Vibrio alfacsensis TaxID=1074311 RepID=UPI001BEF7656|nr:hypothetical protein [Vibrio alfacsensis]BBM67967.1 hypothetical protein VA249_46130 [Vibrio alfacsensis]
MKAILISAALLTLAGYSTVPTPIGQITNEFSFGTKTPSSKQISVNYFNLDLEPKFQNYDLVFNFNSEPTRYTFDLCKDIDSSNSCLSEVHVFNDGSEGVLVNFQISYPTEVANQDEIVLVDSKRYAGQTTVKWDSSFIQTQKYTFDSEENKTTTFQLSLSTK